MQRVLEKMAKQLNEYDEASLMHLWQRYAAQVQDFEPTKRWEEAAIALCLIQAVHWKNQLFNYHLAAATTPVDKNALPPLPGMFNLPRPRSAEPARSGEDARPKATLLRFPDKHKQETDQAGKPAHNEPDGRGNLEGKDDDPIVPPRR